MALPRQELNKRKSPTAMGIEMWGDRLSRQPPSYHHQLSYLSFLQVFSTVKAIRSPDTRLPHNMALTAADLQARTLILGFSFLS